MHSVEQIELGPVRVVGLAARVRNDDPDGIAAHWQRFQEDNTFLGMRGALSQSPVAVYTEYESDYTGAYTMILGYKVAADALAPAGLRTVEIPAQKYAVVLAQGEQPAALIAAWQWVYASALKRTYIADFDEYAGPFDVRLHVAIE